MAKDDSGIRPGGGNHVWMQQRGYACPGKLSPVWGARRLYSSRKICPHSEVVEQGVPLRGPVAGKTFALLFRLQEKFQASAFGRFDLLSNGQICPSVLTQPKTPFHDNQKISDA